MTDLNLPTPHPRRLTDREALDQIAVYMGSHEEWNGGDVCEVVAEILARTGRPPVGDQTPDDLRMYRQHADRLGWSHDGPEADEDEGFPWVITEADGSILDRFETAEERDEALQSGEYPDNAEPAYVSDPGTL